MIIQIDEKTRIKGTSHCWELQRIRTRKGRKDWETRKWFTTFRQALDEAVHREIRLHPARNLADAIEGVSEIVQRVSDLIPPGFRSK